MKYLKKHSTIVTFLLSLLVIGIIFGVILGIKQDSIFKNDIISSLNNLQDYLQANKINNIFYHLLIFGLLIISSFLVPIYFFNFVYILFKGITIGFSLYIFTLLFGVKGFISGLIYNLFTNILFCLIFIFLLIRGANISKNFIAYILNHDEKNLINIKNTLIGIFLIQGLCLIYDICLFAFSNLIISKFLFLF